MTIYTRASLQAFFETGDVPQGADYANLIDSCVNMGETAVQVMAGSLSPTELITARVSAANIGVTGGITAVDANFTGIISAANASFSGTVSAANSLFAGLGIISNGGLRIASDVSASSGGVYASAMHASSGYYESVGIVSALGTTQATAAPVIYGITRAKGVTDGSTTGFVLLANRTGLSQVIYNDNASANLYPPTGGQINALSTNTPFPMAANTPYEIYHIAASAYAVK